jgi:hypothetical protein
MAWRIQPSRFAGLVVFGAWSIHVVIQPFSVPALAQDAPFADPATPPGGNSSKAPDQFSIYCTDNLDGTGRCRRTDNNDMIGCLMIPGQTIACRSRQNDFYSCIFYASALLSCKKMAPESVSLDLKNNPALRLPAQVDQPSAFKDRLRDTLFDTLD